MSRRGGFRVTGQITWPLALLIAVTALVAYWLTACRTITWWENCEYSTAAATLGIVHPPGSLLLTILGWCALKISPLASRIFTLNLFAGLLAAITSGLVVTLALRIRSGAYRDEIRSKDSLPLTLATIAAAVAVLTLTFGETLWSYAVQFTPYVLTALFTALILWAMLRWWENARHHNAIGWLFVIALLFGLDFSVHRTNLLLFPGLLVWVLLGRAKTLGTFKAWLYGTIGLAIGLAVHLVIIVIARSKPELNMGDPSSWSRFWEYVSIQQYGGNWLVNLYPRKGPFFSFQVMDYLRAFAVNYFSVDGPVGVLGILPTLLGLIGITSIWRRDARLAVGLLVLFFLSSFGAIVYFNVPAGFFRSMDRHYLPSLVIFAVFIACGAGAILASIRNLSGRYRSVLAAAAILIVIGLPAMQLARNLRQLDMSKNTFTRDYVRNVFSGLPQDAILITGGDNDTFPLWCLQMVEGLRPDVSVVNIGLLNTRWYPKQQAAATPGIPLGLSDEQLDQMTYRPWSDSTIAVAVVGTPKHFGLTDSATLPDSVHLKVPADIQGRVILAHTQLLLRILQQNRWQRPIFLSVGVNQNMAQWLTPYLRSEGYVSRVVPIESPTLNRRVLQDNLLGKYTYDGYADANIRLDEVSRQMAWNLYSSVLTLADNFRQQGQPDSCRAIVERMKTLLPPDRLTPPEQLRQGLDYVCGGGPAAPPNQ